MKLKRMELMPLETRCTKFMVAELKDILSKTEGEREISSFLSKHPELIRWAVCRTGGHTTYVIKEFPFGSHYKADFIVPFSYSGAWEVHLIELEPPDDMVITRDGLPSNRLNKAVKQINDWQDYIEKNRYPFRSDLSEWCIKKDLLGLHNDLKEPSNYTGDKLKDQDTYIGFNYYIIIGRRENIDQEKRKRMNHFRNQGIRVLTYDALIDIATNIEFSNANPNKSVWLRDSEDLK
jgi:hypothetical protein